MKRLTAFILILIFALSLSGCVTAQPTEPLSPDTTSASPEDTTFPDVSPKVSPSAEPSNEPSEEPTIEPSLEIRSVMGHTIATANGVVDLSPLADVTEPLVLTINADSLEGYDLSPLGKVAELRDLTLNIGDMSGADMSDIGISSGMNSLTIDTEEFGDTDLSPFNGLVGELELTAAGIGELILPEELDAHTLRLHIGGTVDKIVIPSTHFELELEITGDVRSVEIYEPTFISITGEGRIDDLYVKKDGDFHFFTLACGSVGDMRVEADNLTRFDGQGYTEFYCTVDSFSFTGEKFNPLICADGFDLTVFEGCKDMIVTVDDRYDVDLSKLDDIGYEGWLRVIVPRQLHDAFEVREDWECSIFSSRLPKDGQGKYTHVSNCSGEELDLIYIEDALYRPRILREMETNLTLENLEYLEKYCENGGAINLTADTGTFWFCGRRIWVDYDHYPEAIE